MSIKIREPEVQYELSLSRAGWLALIAFLSECHDSGSTEAQVKTVGELIDVGRGFVLSKEKVPEFKTALSREQVLDLYLFFGEFKQIVGVESALLVVQEGFRGFLLGGDE